MAKIKKWPHQVLEQLGVIHTAEGSVKWLNHFEIQVAVSQKVKHIPTTWTSYSTSSYLAKRNENMYICIQIAALFVVAKKQEKQNKQKKNQVSTGTWINKAWDSHIMKYYSEKKKEWTLYAHTTCVNLKTI